MSQRRRFTPAFKLQAVQFLNAGQRPAAEIARELGIPRNRLYKWQKDRRAWRRIPRFGPSGTAHCRIGSVEA